MKRILHRLPISMFAIAIAIGAVNGQELPSSINYNERAKVLPTVLTEISELTGLQLLADTRLKEVVIMLQTRKPVPVETVLEKLASTTRGRWRQTPSGRVLEPDQETIDREYRLAIATRATKLTSALKSRFKSQDDIRFDSSVATRLLASLNEIDPSSLVRSDGKMELQDRAMRAIDASPGMRTLGRLLRHIPAEDLARLHRGDTLLYGYPAYRFERPLSVDSQMLQQFDSEQSVWQAALKSHQGEIRPILPSDPRRATATGKISRAILSIRCVYGTRYLASLIAANDQKQTVLRADADLDLGNSQAQDSGYRSGEFDFKLSPESAEHLKLMNLVPSDAEMQGVAAKWIKRLSDPLKHEPLSFASSELLSSVAGNGPIVASMPDSLLNMPMEIVRHGAIRRASFLEYLGKREDIIVAQDRGWLVVRPSVDRSKNPIDRGPLSLIFGRMLIRGVPSIEDYANLAQQVDQAQLEPLFNHTKELLSGNPDPFNDFDWNTYRLFGALSQGLRAKIREGGAISVLQLPGKVQELLVNCFTTGQGSDRTMSPKLTGMEILSYSSQHLINGFSPDMSLVGVPKSKVGLLFKNVSPRPGEGALYPVLGSNGNFVPDSAWEPNATYLPMHEFELGFSLHLDAPFQAKQSIREYTWDPSSKSLTVGALDDVLRKRIEERRNAIALQKNPGSLIRGRDSKVPPPCSMH